MTDDQGDILNFAGFVCWNLYFCHVGDLVLNKCEKLLVNHSFCSLYIILSFRNIKIQSLANLITVALLQYYY